MSSHVHAAWRFNSQTQKRPANGRAVCFHYNCAFKPSSVPSYTQGLRRAATISLGRRLPGVSSNQPEGRAGHPVSLLFGLAPGGVCRAGPLPGRRCALTAPFQLCLGRERPIGVFFSVALSLGSPPLDVIQHPALRSSDFPRMQSFDPNTRGCPAQLYSVV